MDEETPIEDIMKVLDAEQATADSEPVDAANAQEGEPGAEGPTDIKTNPEGTGEPEKVLEPPNGWRSDEKDLFRSLPKEAQEVSLRLQQAQDSHFSQRSMELATKIRATDDERQQFQANRARYAQELTQLNELATQLLPAKFSDIRSEADYLRLKATDPARASEYEAFRQIVQGSISQSNAIRQSQMAEGLASEWQHFVGKYPEFQDAEKANVMMAGVRKGAVEYYGFTPQEVSVITDHRYIPIIRDALAYRQLEADKRATAAKKAMPAAARVIKPNANTSASPDGKSALLQRARKTDKIYDKVDAITAFLEAGG